VIELLAIGTGSSSGDQLPPPPGIFHEFTKCPFVFMLKFLKEATIVICV